MSICCCHYKPIAARPLHDDDRPVLPTKVTIKTDRELPSAQESNHGDIFYQYKDDKLYCYDNKRRVCDLLTLTDLSINYIEECTVYDTVGKKIATLYTEEGTARPTFTNCRNCGAPVKGHKCEYCETRY